LDMGRARRFNAASLSIAPLRTDSSVIRNGSRSRHGGRQGPTHPLDM
jgi:hypothetical protein